MRPGHAPGPYRLHLWIDDRTPPAITAIPRHAAGGVLRFHVSDAGSGISIPDITVRIDGRQEPVSVSSAGDARVDIGSLAAGTHRLDISASDLQETKNSENASPRALSNTRLVHAAFSVGTTG